MEGKSRRLIGYQSEETAIRKIAIDDFVFPYRNGN
jgi:hypothetical protein